MFVQLGAPSWAVCEARQGLIPRLAFCDDATLGPPLPTLNVLAAVPAGHRLDIAGGALGLSAIFAAIYIAWFSGLVVLVGQVSGVLRRPRAKAWIERVTGSALVAFGIRLTTVTSL